jgi:hypothetical protein
MTFADSADAEIANARTIKTMKFCQRTEERLVGGFAEDNWVVRERDHRQRSATVLKASRSKVKVSARCRIRAQRQAGTVLLPAMLAE